jgi:thiol-disulfide isomerase/thioredoxin
MNLDDVPIMHPSIMKQVLPYLLCGLCIGLVNTLKLSKKMILKISYVLISILVVGGGVFAFKYYNDLRYEGSNSIKFIKENYQSLDSILQRQEFEGKVVYIDLWFSSCSPCIQEFKLMPPIKESLKDENIEYLYLARKTSHPNDIQLWKNAIKKYNLSGQHIYMSDTLEENVWQLIEKNVPNLARAYPHYLIVNQDNIIVSYNAQKPSDKEELVNTIKTLTSGERNL